MESYYLNTSLKYFYLLLVIIYFLNSAYFLKLANLKLFSIAEITWIAPGKKVL